jgi:hypothetical protein
MPAQPTFPVGTRVRVKVDGSFTEATYVGWNDRYEMPSVRFESGRVAPRKIFGVVEGASVAVQDESLPGLAPAAPVAAPAPAAAPVSSSYNVNQRFTFLENLVDMVVSGASNSMLVTGPGGLGKTFTVMKRLALAGLKEEEDYVVIRGFSTPKSMYRALYENSAKLVIFDDCDSVLDHQVSLNILKGALDSYSARFISWLTERPDDTLPDTFEFRGSVIFISNQNLSDISQPLLSRSLFVDLSMTAAEKVERIAAILADIRPDVDMAAKREVLALIDSIKNRMPDFNIRSVLKAIEVRLARPEDWRGLAEYVLTAG